MCGTWRLVSVVSGCGLARVEACQGSREACQEAQEACRGEAAHGWYLSTSTQVARRGRAWHACSGLWHGSWHGGWPAKKCRQFNGVIPVMSLFNSPHEIKNKSIRLTQKGIVYRGELENRPDRRGRHPDLPSRGKYPTPSPYRFLDPTMPTTATAHDCRHACPTRFSRPPRSIGAGCAGARQLGRRKPPTNRTPSR